MLTGNPAGLVERALAFAKAAHEAVGQVRKYTGEPYIVHPIEVAGIIQSVLAHHCDPELAGKPVRVLAVSVYKGNGISGVVVPKWPGVRANANLTLPLGVLQEQTPKTTLIRSLPSFGFNPRRMGDPMTDRNRLYRTAASRVAKYMERTLALRAPAVLPATV